VFTFQSTHHHQHVLRSCHEICLKDEEQSSIEQNSKFADGKASFISDNDGQLSDRCVRLPVDAPSVVIEAEG